jgi:Membrane proteins related to metalloendopeptidases
MGNNIVGPPFPSLGSAIPIYSTAHKSNANVTCLMDTTAYRHQPPDWDWVAEYGLSQISGGGPLPQPYINHRGTDIQKGRGSTIYAISGGTVTVCGGTYNEMYIQLADGTTDCYLHCDIASGMSVGKKIAAGDLIGYENGWGSAGSSTYPSHLHLDKFVTAVGRGPGTIDSFNYSQGGGSGGGAEVYMKVEKISDWDINSDKIGLWVGGVVRVRPQASLFYDVAGTRAVMQKAKGATENAYAWRGEFGESMRTIISNIVKDKVQVSVYDQFGAFHPQIWVRISDII